jgi:hypothetical protein
VKNTLRRVGRTAAKVLPAAALTKLGIPALAGLIFIAVLILGVSCWIIGNEERSDRVIRMILARQGRADIISPPRAVRRHVTVGSLKGPYRSSDVRSSDDVDP